MVRSKEQIKLGAATAEQLRDIEVEKHRLDTIEAERSFYENLYRKNIDGGSSEKDQGKARSYVDILRMMCRNNHLVITKKGPKTGSRIALRRDELIAKIAEARVLGPLPPCPRCKMEGRFNADTGIATGRLVYDAITGGAFCNGGLYHRKRDGKWDVEACPGPSRDMVGTNKLARTRYVPIHKRELAHLLDPKDTGLQYQNGVTSYITTPAAEQDIDAWMRSMLDLQ